MATYALPVTGVYRIIAPGSNKYMQLADGGEQLFLKQLDLGNKYQKWNISVVNGKPSTFRINSFDNKFTLTWAHGGPYDKYGNGYLTGRATATTTWTVVNETPFGPRIYTSENQPYWVNSTDSETVHFIPNNTSWNDTQSWLFELVELGVPPGFEDKFFTLTPEEAAIQHPDKEYDIIIVGSGIGGGVLAHDLFDTNQLRGKKAKRILLLEKGGLVFHSHCLNTARPDGLVNDRGQQNDTFFRLFREDFQFDPPLSKEDWNGGPIFALGGRSSAWGLFAPRIHDDNLKKYVHPTVTRALRGEYYDRAELLMLLSAPQTKPSHQNVMDRLNIEGLEAVKESQVQWEWGRIASEFSDESNYDFARGAYSSIDKLLEIAMSKPTDENGKVVEHEHFKTVLNADVRSLELRPDRTPKEINVRTREGNIVKIPIKPDAKVVLCAGSVHSPAILMRSGIAQKTLEAKNGLHLTDHDIWFYSASFRYTDPQRRTEYGPMKLQSYVRLRGEACLANMSIDASSFLPRGAAKGDDLPQFIMVFIVPRELVKNNSIWIDEKTDEPVIRMDRGPDASEDQKTDMRVLTVAAMTSLVETIGLQFVDFKGAPITQDKIVLHQLQLGGVAHECGTLPMTNSSTENCLDTNLALHPDLAKNVHVCDLSVWPFSPESNPTLSLAALAIRLSRYLNPRQHDFIIAPNEVWVVNQTGAKIKIWLTDYKAQGGGGLAEKAVVLEAGDEHKWDRDPNTAQGLLVFKVDQAKLPDEVTFMDEPVVMVARSGKLNPIRA
ncbi:GMC oxidoreductase [Ceratobasidium sp. AG-Ba]|nr:GMC oxidoreductase [Ceratobasidium sp. AG-Ba]